MNPKPNPLRITIRKHLSQVMDGKKLFLFVCKPETYELATQEVLLYLSGDLMLQGIYIGLKTHHSFISNYLVQKKIPLNRVFFIDGIANSGVPNETYQCLGPNKSLTGLSILMSEVLKTKETKFVFFDSVDDLLAYDDLESTERFIHYVVNRMKILNCALILMTVEASKVKSLMPLLTRVCDEVVFL